MKRRVLPLIIGSLLLQLGCGANDGGLLNVDEPTDPPPVLQPSELCSDNPSSAITTFLDGHLDAAVRDQLSVGAQEDLTCDLLSRLTSLVAKSSSIGDLGGIESLTSLRGLYLPSNSIIDISALSGLTSLTELDLSSNSITDISALSSLTSLSDLWLGGNSITDISALSGLTSLTELDLTSNSITDISVLSGLTSLSDLWLGDSSISDMSALSRLTSLTWLRLNNNSITDISALSGLTSLSSLRLDNNPDLTDIQPLLANTGLGTGDGVNLWNTNVSCTDVTALKAKGVTVSAPHCR